MAKSRIRQAIRQGNTVEALRLLLLTGAEEGALLLDNFSEAEQQRTLGLIGPEEWARIQLQICSAILELHWMKDPDAPTQTVLANKPQILQLLHQRRTEQALVQCADFGDTYLLLQMQFNLARKQSGMGLMEAEYWEMTKSRVNYNLQELLEELPEEKPLNRHWFYKIRSLFR